MGKVKELRDKALELFLSRYQVSPTLKLEYFHTFLCPVAMAEAMVKEHIIEDYDALELLILRLYDIGFHSLDALTSLSGMNRDIVERALNSEIMVYHHIDDEEKKLRKWAERPLKKMKKEERADGIVLRESVEQDEELCREINERIKE